MIATGLRADADARDGITELGVRCILRATLSAIVRSGGRRPA
jgi:hypothetical protein